MTPGVIFQAFESTCNQPAASAALVVGLRIVSRDPSEDEFAHLISLNKQLPDFLVEIIPIRFMADRADLYPVKDMIWFVLGDPVMLTGKRKISQLFPDDVRSDCFRFIHD